MVSKMGSLGEIEEYLYSLSEGEQQNYINLLKDDKRKSIQKLVQKYQSKFKKKLAERERLLKMWDYEKNLFHQNFSYIVGIDEAGRGPLAGPVVAGAVILPPFCIIQGLNDSKKINAEKRQLLAAEIKAQAISWAVGVVDAPTIDKMNILQATRYAMYLALKSIGSRADFFLAQKRP